jgi:outer membrane protein assembly factor BamB
LNVRQLVLVAVAALAVGGTAVAQVGQSGPAGQATPPPPPPPNGNVATPGTLIGTPAPAAATPAAARPTATPAPAASQAPAGRRGRRASTPEPAASASDTPEPPQFSTMDGVWEVQLQPLGTSRAVYSHLAITQKGDQLSGTWQRENNQKVAFTGTFDGRLFKLTSTDGKTTWTFSGYAENYSDMVGLMQTADPKDKGTPFTASHRKKDRL